MTAKVLTEDFPGNPVVKTLLLLQGAWVSPLVRELRSCMPQDVAKSKTNQNKQTKNLTLKPSKDAMESPFASSGQGIPRVGDSGCWLCGSFTWGLSLGSVAMAWKRPWTPGGSSLKSWLGMGRWALMWGHNRRYKLCWAQTHSFLLLSTDVWKWSESDSGSVISDSLWPHSLQPARHLCPWDSPGKNTGLGGHFLPRGIFPTQGSNPGLLHCRQILYHLSH